MPCAPTPTGALASPSHRPLPLHDGVEDEAEEGDGVKGEGGEGDGEEGDNFGETASAATTPMGAAWQPGGRADNSTLKRPGCMRWRRFTSLTRLKCSKKSAPKIGKGSATSKNTS